jgi:hypothetical protein
MLRAFRPLAARLSYGLLALAGASWAGPVQEQMPDGANQLTTLGLAASAAASPASGGAESAASASTLAAEIIKEAGASPHQSEQPPLAKSPIAKQAAAGSRSAASADEEGLNLREMGQEAIRWAKANLPWLGGEADTEEADHRPLPQAANWSVPLPGADMLQQAAAADPTLSPDTSRAKASASIAAPVVDYGKSSPAMNPDHAKNIVRVAIHFIREVVGHPMTWLVVLLVIIGGIVVKKIDRRPTE